MKEKNRHYLSIILAAIGREMRTTPVDQWPSIFEEAATHIAEDGYIPPAPRDARCYCYCNADETCNECAHDKIARAKEIAELGLWTWRSKT